MGLNKDEIEGIAKATAEIVKAVPIYDDAVQPVAQEVGKALKTMGGVINVALAPLSAMVYGYEIIGTKLKARLERKLTKTAPENIITPPLQVVGPLIEKYKYVHDNEDLSEMYVNLLASAMDKDSVQKAHPSFVSVISELSPDEAKLLKAISRAKALPKLDIKIRFIEPNGQDKGSIYIYKNFTLLGTEAGLLYPDLTPTYLSNLERLNLISCPVDELGSSYTDESIYTALENSELIKKLREKYEVGEKKIQFDKRTIQITDFGKLFIKAVISD